ncbi:hypothetical protein PH547_29550 [Rhizobium sp. CNPSo 3464]|nr:hypothetical protein [Rhizobium sp. CNPSo 3464]MDK4743036.1 hypothetical protein [Rhizobium sp. CNPSo 3464]
MLKSLSSNDPTAFDIVNIVAGLGSSDLTLVTWLHRETYAAWNG